MIVKLAVMGIEVLPSRVKARTGFVHVKHGKANGYWHEAGRKSRVPVVSFCFGRRMDTLPEKRAFL